MPYIIENASGEPIIIPDGDLNTDYSIDLIGRNYENYGQVIAKTQIDLLDNFATQSSPPSSPTSGQLWFDKGGNQLRVYDATTGSWLPTRTIVSGVAPANQYGQNRTGTNYYNTSTGQMYVNVGGLGYREASIPGEISNGFISDGALLNPSNYGSSIRNIFLTDTEGVKRAVLALFYRNDGEITSSGYFQGESIIAVFSGHTEEFEVGDAISDTGTDQFNFYEQFNFTTSPAGLGPIIRPGMNTRVDDNTLVNTARKSLRADQAYQLNTGTYTLTTDGSIDDGVDEVIISASDVFNANANSIPNVQDSLTLGESGNVFAQSYVTNMFVGNGISGKIESNGSGILTIGTAVKPVSTLYAADTSIFSTLKFPNGSDIAESSTRAGAIYATGLDLQGGSLSINNYILPESKGAQGDTIYVSNAGASFFGAPLSDVKDVTSTGGTIDIATTNVASLAGTIPLNSRNLDLTVNTTKIREMISVDVNSANDLSYSSTTGRIKYIRVTPFDNLVPETHFVLRQGGLSQDITGVKTFRSRADFAGGIDVATDIRYGDAADYPVGVSSGANSLTFKTFNTSTAQNHTIVFSRSGDITASGDIIAFSDRNLKDNIEPITDAVAKVKKITGYTFNYKGADRKHAGVIAQEVQEVLPEVVTENTDGTLGVAYGNMVGLLIEAIKDLSEEVDELKKKLND